MQIYLPIAEMPVDVLVILLLGCGAGVLSGMFGVGGGFLMTPLLMFIGIPPAVAVSSVANQIMAASFSGFLTHWRRSNVDFRMGTLLTISGITGSSVGVALFAWLKSLGQIDLVISLSYVFFLGGIGAMMANESIRTWRKSRRGEAVIPLHTTKREWLEWTSERLPFVMEFPRSKLKISAILPLVIGFFVGILVSLMGIGGGFIMIPAMIYILRMPTSIVVGTSLFQIIFITGNVTLLQAINTHTVDIILAFLLLIGSVTGAQIGTRIGMKMRPEQLRAMLAIMVLGVAVKLGIDLFTEPKNHYEIEVVGG